MLSTGSEQHGQNIRVRTVCLAQDKNLGFTCIFSPGMQETTLFFRCKASRTTEAKPAQVARDRAKRKDLWKRMEVSRQPRAENLDTHYAQLQETRPVASPQVSMVSHLVNSWCLNCTYTVSEARTVASPQVRRRWLCLRGFPTASVVSPPGNSGRLGHSSSVSESIIYFTGEWEKHSSILVETFEDLEVECAYCLKIGQIYDAV